MHQNPFTILALLLTLILFSTCDSTSTQAQATAPTPESLLVKSWKLQKLNIQGEMAPPQIMTTSSFNFYENGRYEILMGELERGTWSLSEDKHILITRSDAGGESQIDIESLEADRMILYNQAGPNPIRMELVPQ